MAFIGRASVPQEFIDFHSAKLLRQPTPQFFHAGMAMNAMRLATAQIGKLGLPIPGRTFGGEGMPYANLQEMMVKLSPEPDAVYGKAIMVVPELGKRGQGHSVKINRPKFTNTTATKAARRLPSGAQISKSGLAVGSEQVIVTIERYGGPYSDTNSAVQPFAIDRFDANKMQHDPASFTQLHLDYDFHLWLDTVNVQLFDLGAAVYPDGMTADNDSTVAGDYPMSFDYLTKVEANMRAANIPTFENGRYMFVATVRQMQQLRVDGAYQRLAVFNEDINPVLKKSYRGTVGNLDIFESTTLTTSLNASNVSIQYGQCFGPESVGWAIDEMPRVATDSDDNFGETAKLVWLFYAASEVLDSRFQRSCRTS